MGDGGRLLHLEPKYLSDRYGIQLNHISYVLNTLNADLKPIRHLLALVGAHHIVHVSRVRVKGMLDVEYTVFAQNDVPDIFQVCPQQVWIPGAKADRWVSFVHILEPVHS